MSEGLKLNGSQVLTNVEQYMGSNVRVLSPSMVNEFRFGYTRFFNSAGRELAFERDVVTEIGIPGPERWQSRHMGDSERRASRTTAASATTPKVRTRTTITRCSSSTILLDSRQALVSVWR